MEFGFGGTYHTLLGIKKVEFYDKRTNLANFLSDNPTKRDRHVGNVCSCMMNRSDEEIIRTGA